MEKKASHVQCPCCNNKRLFDVSADTNGQIEIKCPRCGNVILIQVQEEQIAAEPIAANMKR